MKKTDYNNFQKQDTLHASYSQKIVWRDNYCQMLESEVVLTHTKYMACNI